MPRILQPTPDSIAEAAAGFRVGRLAAFATETVYGLGGDATNDRAVAQIFSAKNRPEFNPLIVHLPDSAATRGLVEWSPLAENLAQKFWPGPLTLVLRRAADCPVSLLASAGLDTLAVRVPSHPVAQALLRAAGVPICAPSANRSGRVSPTTAAHVAEEFSDTDLLVLDGGATPVGIESTVLDLTTGRAILLRPGGVTVEEMGIAVDLPGAGPIRSPGMLQSHYAPRLPVRLDAREARPREALLAFGGEAPTAGYAAVRWLSRSGNLAEAAAGLFAALRELDRPDYAGIAVSKIPEQGLGRAINDRLRRAAAERSVA